MRAPTANFLVALSAGRLSFIPRILGVLWKVYVAYILYTAVFIFLYAVVVVLLVLLLAGFLLISSLFSMIFLA